MVLARALLTGWGRLEVKGFDGLWLAWSEVGLVAVAWTEAGLVERAGRLSDEAFGPAGDIPGRYGEVLRGYFAAEAVDPACLDVDLRGTAFQQKVWHALRRIPRGQVQTYGGIAAELGSPRAAQAVGAAAGANPLPIVVPCHRLVETKMGIGGYSGGLERKRLLLELEGARVVGDVVQPGQLVLL